MKIQNYIISLAAFFFICALIEAPAQTPNHNATTSTAQELIQESDEEVLKVDTSLSRVNVYLHSQLRKQSSYQWFAENDSTELRNLQVDAPAPDDSYQLVVILDIDEKRSNINGLTLQRIKKELYGLQKLNLTRDVRVYYVGEQPISLPKRWTAYRQENFNQAVGSSVAFLKSQDAQSRQTLLILTDRFAQLPPDIIEQLDNRLKETSSLVFVMSAQNKGAAGIAATYNVNGGKTATSADQYINSSFVKLRELMQFTYVVWFEMPPNAAAAGTRFRVKAGIRDFGSIADIAANTRVFTMPAATVAAAR